MCVTTPPGHRTDTPTPESSSSHHMFSLVPKTPHLAAQGGDFGRDGVGVGRNDVGDRDPGALAGKGNSDRSSNSASATGHDSDLARHVFHRSLLSEPTASIMSPDDLPSRDIGQPAALGISSSSNTFPSGSRA